MSRRRGADRLSSLDRAYADAGAYRPAEAARRLGVGAEAVSRYTQAGLIGWVRFDYQGRVMTGPRIDAVDELAEKLRDGLRSGQSGR